MVALAAALTMPVTAQTPEPPALTQPVNDFANVIDGDSERALDSLVRALQQASGDVVVVATVDTVAPYGDIREYAVKMFENRGRGIGQTGRDNGALILVAVKDRQVWVEVGYDLEQFVTDGFAGETSRQLMVPEFRRGDYGAGLVAGATRIVDRIAQGRNVTLQGVRREPPGRASRRFSGSGLIVTLFVLFVILNAISGRRRGRRGGRWGGPGSGWHSGVGAFGAGFGGLGGSGGGFGGGFGGFGGGHSGGGGGGGSW